MKNLKLLFMEYKKEAPSLKDFCDTYHNYEYSQDDYEDHRKDMEKYGYTIIPAHDSITGTICSYYG